MFTLISTFFHICVFPVGLATADPVFLKSLVGGTFPISIHSFMWNLPTSQEMWGRYTVKEK